MNVRGVRVFAGGARTQRRIGGSRTGLCGACKRAGGNLRVYPPPIIPARAASAGRLLDRHANGGHGRRRSLAFRLV